VSSSVAAEMNPAGGKGVVRLTPDAARLIGSHATEDAQLAVLGGTPAFPPRDFFTVVCILAGCSSSRVREAAMTTLRTARVDELVEFLSEPELHPRFLDLIARVRADDAVVAELITWHPAVSESTRSFLDGCQDRPMPSSTLETLVSGEKGVPSEPSGAAAEFEDATFRSPYQQAPHLGIGEKIKIALTGDKEWRTILVKDTIKPVCCAVLKNPRITEAEVLAIARSAVQYDDIIRLICANREWLKKYPIRKALVENHRTPLPVALKLLATLSEKDLAFLSKSKNISSVLASQARRLTLAKKQK